MNETKVIPVHRPESMHMFANHPGLPIRSVTIGDYVVDTAPLAFGKRLDLLGISQTDCLLDSGIQDPTDCLDPAINLENIYFSIANAVFCVRVMDLPFAGLSFVTQGDGREMNLNFSANLSIGYEDSMEFMAGDNAAAVGIAPMQERLKKILSESKILISISILGKASLQTGSLEVVASPSIYQGVRGKDKLESWTPVLPMEEDTYFANTVIEPIGYDLSSNRVNPNRRPRQREEEPAPAKYIDFHQVDGDYTPLRLETVGEPSATGSYQVYDIKGFDVSKNPSSDLLPLMADLYSLRIFFQNGAPPLHGYNGVTIEDLLAVCSHRLQGFQSGAFACDENRLAIHHINAAIIALNQRTIDRIARHVKDTTDA